MTVQNSEKPQSRPVLLRAFFAIPLIGWLAEGLYQPDANGKLLALANIGMIWLLAIFLFGYPAFVLPVMAMVPVVFAMIFALMRD